MHADYTQLFNLNRFSTGRRLFTFRQVLKAAGERDDDKLVVRVQAAIDRDRETHQLELEWRRQRGASAARGNAAEIDQRIDRVLVAMHTSVETLATTLEPSDALAEKARTFLKLHFPEGAGAITNSSVEDQLATEKAMLASWANMKAKALEELHIAVYVDALRALVPQLERELEAHPPNAASFATLRSARQIGHENLIGVTAAIVAGYPGHEPEAVAARAALLGPILEQNEKIRARRRRRPAPDVEVDPTTGEEDVTGEDDAEPVEDPPV